MGNSGFWSHLGIRPLSKIWGAIQSGCFHICFQKESLLRFSVWHIMEGIFFRLSWHFLKLNSSLTLLGYLIPGLLANEFPWISEWRKSNINDEGRSKWILMCNKTNKIKKKLVIHQSSDLILSSLGAVNSRKFSSSSGLESLDEEVLFASAVSKKRKERKNKKSQ